MKGIWTVIVFLCCFCVVTSASGKVVVADLRYHVEGADWILIGEVVSIESTNIRDHFGDQVKVARIKPYEFLKGEPESEFAIEFTPLVADGPKFMVNKSYLLFIRKTASGPSIGSYLGALEIANGTVSTWEILGEPEKQSLEGIVEKIKKMLEK
jgi:hypothetical protein